MLGNGNYLRLMKQAWRLETPLQTEDGQHGQRSNGARLWILLAAIEMIEERITAIECVQQLEVWSNLERESAHVGDECTRDLRVDAQILFVGRNWLAWYFFAWSYTWNIGRLEAEHRCSR